MALLIGQAQSDPVTGLAGEIYTAWLANPNLILPESGGAPANANERKFMASLCEAVATGVINHFTAHGQVVVSVGGLQRDHTAGSPATLAPAAPVSLSIT